MEHRAQRVDPPPCDELGLGDVHGPVEERGQQHDAGHTPEATRRVPQPGYAQAEQRPDGEGYGFGDGDDPRFLKTDDGVEPIADESGSIV